jgi:endothelin-converting enzyme/putative endopeptidase
MAANPIPPDRGSFGRGSQLALRNQYLLKDILEKAASQPSPDKIGTYYAACMDEKTVNRNGIAALKLELDRIAKLKSKNELARQIAHMHQIGFQLVGPSDSGGHTALMLFSSGQDLDDASKVVAWADQGGIALPDREYYLKTDEKSLELRKQYQAHVQKMFELAGDKPQRAASAARVVLEMETALGKGALDVVKRRDPANLNHKMSQEQMQALSPSFRWTDYLATINAPKPDHYLVTAPEFFKAIEQLIQSRSLDDWKSYLRWHLLHGSAQFLSDPFVNEDFNFFAKALIGAKELRPRWRRCVQYVDQDLGELLGQAFVERTFGADGKERMLKLVNALEEALGRDIQELDWMSQTTKQDALKKLKAIKDKIGYPDKWRDYSALQIKSGDLLGNAFRGSSFELARQLAKIGNPPDRNEWTMTPPTVNAYYDPQMNTVNFPAGILQPPFFDKEMDEAVNFGGTGSVIGHELTHGFDDQGRQFDAKGDLRDWWAPEDGKRFNERAACVADEYSSFTGIGDLKVNGRLTLGENVADNGGARVSLMALLATLDNAGKRDAKIDGLTAEQRFFLAYGQVWCSNLTDEFMRLLVQTNPHSPPRYRVNGVLSNMPEFHQAYGCKVGQPMVRENACRVW